ncbi:MAG: transglutaminase domain-containing protein [Luteolibacter sp.]
MKWLAIFLFTSVQVFAHPLDEFIATATGKHGAFGEKAARFLVEHMPASDKEALTAGFLIENLDLALKARETFPWAGDVPEEIFLNDVLPYAVFDEPRDPWRADFLGKAGDLVKHANTASEAAQILNREFFKLIRTHYHTERKRTNQSPKESMEQGKATCTGLSIILVAACRSVGIPARAVGTPMWHDNSGNHTWVEIWDQQWHFTGADEFNDKGLNHAWFTVNASRARADNPRHAIFATSWKKDGTHFPMVWAPESRTVGGVNVTQNYLTNTKEVPTTIGIRFFEGDARVVKTGELTTVHGMVLGSFETKAGTADMNDMQRLMVEPGVYRLRFDHLGVAHETQPIIVEDTMRNIHDIRAADLAPAPDFSNEEAPLSREDAMRAIYLTHETMLREQNEARNVELEARSIRNGDHTMRWLEKSFGDAPHGMRSLWISMHGGGGAPARVNDQQWQNQIRLYQPEEGIYVAPRAPTDTWNLWHQDHVDPLFDRLIENMVALRGVSPDRIYLMGYSAGGDGVWQLAPRMADRFAAAAMMAGHPNESSLLGLRNLPFGIFMGENDAAYERNTVAAEKSAELAALHKADPGGYTHLTRIYPGLGHWMDLKCAEALPWMAQYQRNPWPKKIVWLQDDVVHHRFYWLRLPEGTAVVNRKITAHIEGRTIRLEGDVLPGTEILLSDALIDLDDAVTVSVNDTPAFTITPQRTLATIRAALGDRLDPVATPTATIRIP